MDIPRLGLGVNKSVEHFRFGENWRDYLRHVDDAAVAQAEIGLLNLIPAEKLSGADFIDIGCGSGIHALAAWRLGANVTAVDRDPSSAAATRHLAAAYEADIDVSEQDVFDTSGQFDIVYSWGVLHHTGDMWNAIRHASTLVRPGGLFAIALYQKTPMCGAWKGIKRFYSRRGKLGQFAIRAPYTGLLLLRLLASGKNPVRHVREYKRNRGMNFFTDVHDWLGGYPYESASPAEIVSFFSDLRFALVTDRSGPSGKGIFGSGCGEFTFKKSGRA